MFPNPVRLRSGANAVFVAIDYGGDIINRTRSSRPATSLYVCSL